MNRRDVELFYNNYKKSIVDIARLERRLLKESYSYEKWYDVMIAQSKTLRDIYAQNLKEYDNVIKYAVEHADELSDEVNAELLVHVDFFLSEGFRDYGVTVPVIKAILPYWERVGNPGKVMDCNYFLGISLFNSHYCGEACNAFTAALSCFDDFMECPEPYWTYRMMCAAYYRLLAYVELNRFNDSILLEYYQEAYNLWTDPRVEDWMESPTKKAAIPEILRVTLCSALNQMLDNGDIPSEELLGILVEQFECEQNGSKSTIAQVVYSKYLRMTGRMRPNEYEDALIGIRDKSISNHSERYTYGLWEFTALFDDELPDETFSPDKLFHVNTSFQYVKYVLSELLMITESEQLRGEISQEMYRYFLEMPALQADGYIDSALYPILAVLVARCTDRDLLIDCILNLTVHRQIVTAIHVTMVARLARCVVRHMLPVNPEYFCGIAELNTVEDVLAHPDIIEDFAYKASVCHDIGKLTCTDVIRLQNRKILNEEFERIKNHSIAGASILMNSETLFDYAFVALCHHIFDDESRGYPLGAVMPMDSSKIIVEIVTICDSIDAMSDTLGRNYATSKDMDTIVKELAAESGSRYSGRVVRFLTSSPVLIEDLNKELYENRIQVNYDIYRRYVVPDTKFRPEDEKYIAVLEESETEYVFNTLGLNVESHTKLYSSCRDYSYVIKDGRDTLYGILMCEPRGNDLWVRQGYVLKNARRQGIGSLMMHHLENAAFEAGIEYIYVPEKIKGHYDKFAWHNGFISTDKEGWLAKRIKM